jgi:hypothetical protein
MTIFFGKIDLFSDKKLKDFNRIYSIAGYRDYNGCCAMTTSFKYKLDLSEKECTKN